LREEVIKKLDLMSRWKINLMEDALRTLDGLTDIDQTEDGLIIISTTERSGELAQKMAQAYVEELDRVNRNLRFSTARQTREFIEKRLKETEAGLQRTAESLRDFQKKYGVISLEEQTRASIRAAAEIRAQVAVKEVEYEMLRRQFSESHEQIKLLKANIAALEQQLQRVEDGENSSKDVLLAFSNIPDLGMQYVFLLKDTEVQKAVYKLLAQQYEEARIRETRDTPTVQVLDAPALPHRKSKPKRLYFVLAGVMLSFFVSGFEIILRSYLDRLKTTAPEDYNRVMEAYETLRADLLPWKRKPRRA
jgi:capsule polysaccharide export protein KpsE/RkpR